MNNYRTIQQKAMQLLFPAWEQNIPSLGTKHSHLGNKTGLRFAVTLLLMLFIGGSTEAWGQNYKYIFINNKGHKAFNYSTNNTTTGKTTLAIHPKAKSVLATNFRFYTTEAAAVADANGTIGTAGTDYYVEGTTISGITDVTNNTFYVRYDLVASPSININGGKWYKLQIYGRNKTLYFIYYDSSDNTLRINNTDGGTENFLWRFDSGDPYDVYITNLQGLDYLQNGVVSTTGAETGDGGKAKLTNYQQKIADNNYDQSAASMTSLQSFVITQGYNYSGTWSAGMYQIVGAYNGIENKPKDVQPGGGDENAMPYYICRNNSSPNNGNQLDFARSWRNEATTDQNNVSQIKFIEVSKDYTFHIINNSGIEAVKATATLSTFGETITASMMPDVIKSPLASDYKFYPTAADAVAGTNELSTLSYSSKDIYVRYTTTSSSLNINGGQEYYITTAGNFLYASSTTALGVEDEVTVFDNTRKWKLNGNDAYQLTIENADNNQYVTYDVSSGEAVPTLSASGSKFFLHEGADGKYEVVAVTTADYSSEYYTLGVASNTLKLYSNSNYPLGEGEVQTSIQSQVPCAQPTISLNSNTGEVTISSSTSGASIYYTTDGNIPTVDPANLYSSLTITETTTINAIAVKDGYINSSVATQTFNQVETPVIQKEGTKSIVITCATAGAAIHYTIAGAAPDASSPTYSTPLSDGVSNKLIQVFAIKDGMVPATASNTIRLQCDKPTILRGNKKFTISCDYPSGADIYYTDDGSTPSSSKTKYTGEVSFDTYNFTVKAIAISSPDYDDSEVAEKVILEDLDGEGTAGSPYLIYSNQDIGLFVDKANVTGGTSAYFRLMADVDAGDEITEPFSGTFEGGTDANGNFYKISGLTHALFNTINNGTVKNVILKDINIQSGDSDGDAGAICNKATGNSRIYNCGVLGTLTETKDAYGNVTNIESTSSISGSGNVGSIVGLLDGTSRVINCYSYANVSGGTMAAGIVGNNAQASTQSSLKTIVVNCMFYGDISGNGSKYPVYGNNSINNDSDTGINPYCYFRKNATFNPTNYNRSWPAEEKNLTRFEYYRSVLNSNRKLCTWWVNGTNGTAPTDNDVTDVGIAKWVLDPSIAPYPILKEWGKYPSVINQDSDKRVDPSTKTWVNRDNASANWGKDMAPDTEGQILGTVSVTINAGSHHSGTKHPTGSTSKFINITAMDTEYNDYCYGKIQLPYYNEIFGNPNEADHAAKYAGNYTDWVVTGWEISGGSDAENFNFADRNSYKGRIFAQGGYFYVPKGVTSISITAHWGKAVYLSNRGYSIDRVKVTKAAYKEDKAFAPAGTISNNFQGYDVYDDLQNAIKALGTNTDYPTVYDQAIVLIGNHQVKNGSNDVGYNLDSKWHPFTFMSADLDFDNEPDNCLELQFRNDIDRPGIQPIRFDFLPVIELGLALRHDNLAYAIGIMVPQGHFEVTETAFMRTTQFEYDGFRSYTDKRIEDKSPVIINGGEYEMFTVRYHNSNRTSYFLLGGNAWIHRFAPGAHPNMGNSPQIYLCPINVIGGEVKELYLTGLYRPELAAPANQGAPRCYTDGGKFDIIAGAGYDKVAAGSNVTFIINHSKITEFYGGGINGSNAISGNIDVTIDNSYVDKYCGGPKVGDMTGKTVTTHATGTTFGVFYGGGNGGNSYYRQLQRDGDQPSSNIGNWNYDPQNYTYHWDDFTPLGVKDDDVNDENKGYHAEYEFEVFNQSNGVKDQITQRGFIKWIQFGITKTGNVSNTLSNCKILNNFYGGGNLATVDGDVTSTLTNTTVNGSVFGAGYSAAIPTFQVHDKGTAVFPSITAGVITDGHIDYDSNVYEWTNEPDTEEHDADYMKAHPTYQKNGKWYCYTWNSLDDLGAVTGNVSLTIDGNTTLTDGKVMKVNESVYGGGESSDVAGNTEVKIKAGKVEGNVYGGGKIGDVGTHEQIANDNIGNYNWKDQDGNPNGTDANKNTGVCKVEITGGTIGPDGNADDNHGNVFGGGKGDNTTFWCEKAMVYSTNVTINNGTVKGSVFGGGEIGRVETDAVVKIGDGEGVASGGTPTSTPEIKGSVFGAGKGLKTHGYSALVRGNVTLTIEGNAKVYESVYGGGELASVGKHKVKTSNDPLTPTDAPADLPVGMPYTLDGTNVGECTVNIQGYAEITNNVFGAGQGVGAADYNYDSSFQRMGMNGWEGLSEEDYSTFLQTLALTTDTDVNIGGNAKVKKSVYGGSENGFVQYDTDVSILGSCEIGISGTTSEGNVYGGGRGISGNTIAGPVSGNSTVTINGGTTYGSVYGGGAYGVVKESVAVNVTGGEVKKDVYGGGALAHTNTANWTGAALVATYPYHEVTGLTVGTSVVTGLYTQSGSSAPYTYEEISTANTKAADATTYYRLTNTQVSLTGGKIVGNAYGGGLGDSNTPAYVYSDVTVKLNNNKNADDKGCIVNQVFGCNNVNGSPKGNVMVHIYATQNKQTTTIGQKFIREIDSDTAKGENETDPAYVTRLKGILTGKIAFAEALNITVSDEVKALCTAESPAVTDLKTAITSVTTSINVKTTEQINSVRYDMEAVYGGGNMAAYVPDSPFDGTSGSKTQVIVEGCDATSIETVYGGGNAAAVPETNVTINAAYEIGYVFGGGNGKDDIAPGVTNPGADVGQYNNGTETVTYGTGNANSTLIGGLIHEAYGGSNTRGVIKGSLNQTTDPGYPEDPNCCELIMDKVVGAGKYADIDGDVNMTLSCQPNRKINELFAGADEANVNGNITLNITNGHFGKVFGGNNLGGAVKGKITVNVEETECQPIKIDNLYLGGNQAAYSVYGYYESEDIHPVTGKKILKPRVSANDSHTAVPNPATDVTHTFPYAQPELNIISCTYIGNVFGGGLGKPAKMYANPTVNVNMVAGRHAATAVPAMMTELGLDVTETAANPDNLGIIRNVYGGGDAADVEGNTTVNIAVEYVVKQVTVGADVTGYYTRSGAGTTADPFVYTAATSTAVEGTTYYEKKNAQGSAYIIGSVFGGGNAADVLGNTNVTMSDGYVFNGIFGGGYAGNVGTFTRSSALEHTEVYGHTAHASKCIGKPISCKEGTGLCKVVVNGGQIGPISVATQGMNRAAADGGPVPQGWVWGGGQGLIEDPAKEPDTHFKSYVGSTDVTIGGTAFVLESIIGGGEFGRVLGNTKVTITGNCQIGVGANQTETIGGVLKPKRYTEAQFIDPTTTEVTEVNALAECSHFPYGEDTNEDGIKDTFLPYDPYYDKYKAINSSIATSDLAPASTASPSDGKTWIGCVFAGGSGYMPYEKEDGSGYDWCSSAGLVEGNTELIISGGHILTNVYGGNEVTNVKGTCKVTMTGGTIGVPRTLDQILAHPVICNLFGAGKGDQRTHFNKETNVEDVEVIVEGGIIYGSVFGGGEDGHVLRDVSLTIGKDNHTGPVIGTWGTSYMDGNVFGGGRGFGGDAYTAGNVAGSVDLKIKGGTILGSVYGGGRLGSVGYGLYDSTADGYGEIRDDKKFDDGTDGSSYFTHGRGHVDIAISGGTIGNRWEYVNVPTDENNLATWKTTNHVPNTEYETTTETIEDKSTTPSTTTTLYHHRLKHTKGGNVFAGGMGRLYQLDGTSYISDVDWWKLGCVKSTKLTITGGTIKSNVYGGGELGQVVGYHTTKNAANESINASTEIIIQDDNTTIIGTEVKDGSNNTQYTFGSVFGGGYGSLIEKIEVQRGTSTISSYPKYIAGLVKKDTKIDMQTGAVKASIYGGGEMASVGESTTSGETTTVTGSTYVAISGGTVGIAPIEVSGTKRYFGGAKMGNVYGGGSGHGNTVRSGRVMKNTNVTISGSDTRIYHNIYGGGAYGTVGEFKYTEDPNNYNKVIGVEKLKTSGTGVATVTITGGTIGSDGKNNGMVFGSSRGDINAPNERDDHTAWVYDANVTIGTQGSETGPAIKGSVYGSGENGHTFHNTDVKVHSGTIGITDTSIDGGAAYAYRGNVYGGGCGTDKYYEDPTQETHDGNGQLYNPLAGIVYGNATVTMDGGHVVHNVYGAGAMGSVGKASDAASGKTTINISGGRIGYDGEGNGHVFGAARGDLGVSTAASNLSNVRETEVNINYTTTPAADNAGKTAKLIAGSVFGGGEAGTVKGSVAVNMTGGLILKDIYGGGALADTQTSNWDATSNTWATGMVTNGKTTYKTTVNLLGGTIGGDAYGGGLGQKTGFNGGTSDIEATVYGDITVNLGDEGATKATAFNISYEDTDDKDDNNNYIQVVGSGRVFGCNNLNGSPQGDVTVNVYKTVTGNVGRTDAENSTAPAQEQRASRDANVPHTYELAAVYGGGNLADYTATGKKASVTIHTCDVSVQHVYGGGNAAAVPETDVLVKGAWEIDHVFGGGNGKDKFKKGNQWILNEGANVSGNTNTLLIGGYIHEAYGGSNEKGTIGGNVTINTNSEHEDCACDLELVKLYGAGKNADIEGDLIVVLGCAPETKTEEVYGGAENANVRGNVELTITSGTFGKVFGGNNQSGAIFGHIILNIEETNCRPIIIDELYGCGNNAAYSVYGYKNGGTDYEGYPIYVPRTSTDDGTAVTFDGKPHTVPDATTGQYDDPEVNIISCTRIGKVFGGGWGSGAIVYGNPTVNIDQIYGKAYSDADKTQYDAVATSLGEIGDVFGGGNEANVVGNTNVNIGTKKEVWLHQSVDANGNYTMYPANTGSGNGIPVVGANITGNVYGGGNEAEVTGDTNVNIGKKSE